MTRSRSALCLGALLSLAACKGEPKRDVLAQDSTLARDLELANRDTTAQPQLHDVPVTPPPAEPAPAPVAPRRVASRPAPPPAPRRTTPRVVEEGPPPPPRPTPVRTPSGNTVEPGSRTAAGRSTEGRTGTVAAGTTIPLVAGQRICTNTATEGDRFTATLANDVTGSNGTVLPAGSTAIVEVTSVKRSANAGDNMVLGLAVRSITYAGKTYPVIGEVASADVNKVRAKDNNDAAKVAGGAVAGAILGRILGGRSKTKGTIIGAAGGAAAGAVLAQQTAKYDACIADGGRITVRLSSPMQIQSTSGTETGGSTGI